MYTSRWAPFTFTLLLSSLVLSVLAHPNPPAYQRNEDTACTSSNMAVRREWSTLTSAQRLDYINSVQCLMRRPSQIPSGQAPGARSRYDDFLATHISRSYHIHGNAVFLTWHRHFIYLFEKALKDECNFQGTLPYWNWALHQDLSTNPIFDGAATSLGGNGVASADGCVKNGSFADTTVHFRNFPPPNIPSGVFTLPPDALNYNPHCLRRNFTLPIVRNFLNQQSINDLLSQPNITSFQRLMDNGFFVFGPGTRSGVHGSGHIGIGADMSDFVASPGDPVFYLHHGMIDLVYTLWQSRDPATRYQALNGTDYFLNPRGSTMVGLDFVHDFQFLGQGPTVGELMDVTRGPYCYRYDYQPVSG